MTHPRFYVSEPLPVVDQKRIVDLEPTTKGRIGQSPPTDLSDSNWFEREVYLVNREEGTRTDPFLVDKSQALMEIKSKETEDFEFTRSGEESEQEASNKTVEPDSLL